MTKQFALKQLSKAKAEGYTNLYYTDTEGYEVAIQRDNYAKSADEAQLYLASDNNFMEGSEDEDVIDAIGMAPWAFWPTIDEVIGFVKDDLLEEE